MTTKRRSPGARRGNGWVLPLPAVPHTVVCETCGQLSVRPHVTLATGRMFANTHAAVEPGHIVHVEPVERGTR